MPTIFVCNPRLPGSTSWATATSSSSTSALGARLSAMNIRMDHLDKVVHRASPHGPLRRWRTSAACKREIRTIPLDASGAIQASPRSERRHEYVDRTSGRSGSNAVDVLGRTRHAARYWWDAGRVHEFDYRRRHLEEGHDPHAADGAVSFPTGTGSSPISSVAQPAVRSHEGLNLGARLRRQLSTSRLRPEALAERAGHTSPVQQFGEDHGDEREPRLCGRYTTSQRLVADAADHAGG